MPQKNRNYQTKLQKYLSSPRKKVDVKAKYKSLASDLVALQPEALGKPSSAPTTNTPTAQR